jgi:hypothetical protein
MARLVWVAVGAVGGIYAYKRASQAMDTARERGVVGNVNAAATTATSLVGNVRQFVTVASGDLPSSGARVQRRTGAAQAMYFAPAPDPSAVHRTERPADHVDIDLRLPRTTRPL